MSEEEEAIRMARLLAAEDESFKQQLKTAVSNLKNSFGLTRYSISQTLGNSQVLSISIYFLQLFKLMLLPTGLQG